MSGSTHVLKRAGLDRNGTLEVWVDSLDDVTINYITYLGCYCTPGAATLETADIDFRADRKP
jgi:hypothetical protein